MGKMLYTKRLTESLIQMREVIQQYLHPYLLSIRQMKENPEDFKKKGFMVLPQKQVLEQISSVFNAEFIEKIRGEGLVETLDLATESELRKYLGISRKGGEKIGDYRFDENGRIFLMKKVFEANDPQKRKIERVSFGIRSRIQHKEKGFILESDSGSTEEYCSETNMWRFMHEHPDKYLAWSRMSSEEKKDFSKYYDIISFANVVRFYAGSDLNNEVFRQEGRVKSYMSLSSKLVYDVFLKASEDKVKFPKDIAGILGVMPQWMLFPATKTMSKMDFVDSFYMEFSPAFNVYKQKHFRDFEILSDEKKLNLMFEKAMNAENQYSKILNIKRKIESGKKSGKPKISRKGSTQEKRLEEYKQALRIYSKPVIISKSGLIIKHLDFTPEWKSLYEKSVLIGHDSVYALERRENDVRVLESSGLDLIVPYLIDVLKKVFKRDF